MHKVRKSRKANATTAETSAPGSWRRQCVECSKKHVWGGARGEPGRLGKVWQPAEWLPEEKVHVRFARFLKRAMKIVFWGFYGWNEVTLTSWHCVKTFGIEDVTYRLKGACRSSTALRYFQICSWYSLWKKTEIADKFPLSLVTWPVPANFLIEVRFK